MSWGSLINPPWWPASPSGSLATPCYCWYNLWYTFLALGFISMLLVVVICLLTPCVIGVMSSFNMIYSLLLDNPGYIFKSFWCGGSHPLLGTAQGHVGKKNVCVSGGGDADLIGVTGAWYSGFGWSGFVGWGVILLLCIPLVAGETLKNPIPDHTSEVTSEISLHPFLSPYAHLSIPGFLALGLVLPCVVPHLGGYCALGSLAEALTWGVLAVSAVAGFNSQALYQHILYWFGYRPYNNKVNLPAEYQSNLEHRLRELTVEFTLEESLLAKAQSSLETDSLEASHSRQFKSNSVLQPELVSRTKPTAETLPSVVPEVKTESAPQATIAQGNLDPLLSQFDTLNIQPEPASDDIQQHLAELFSTTKTLSSHRTTQPTPQSTHFPSPSRRDYRHPTLPNELYSSLPLQLSYSNPTTFQKPYNHFHSPAVPNSANGNIATSGDPKNNEAPPLPPPNPLPKPSDLNQGEGSTANSSDLDANLSQLVFMGFSQDSALQALQANNGSLDQAIEALLSGQF